MSLILRMVQFGESLNVPMDDFQISVQLALAIGWEDSDLMMELSPTGVAKVLITLGDGTIRQFHYMDWRVIAPIAVATNGFPSHYKHLGDCWESGAILRDAYGDAMDVVPQKAIALAVIAAASKGKL